jgi:excisionase family DNA binding protein
MHMAKDDGGLNLPPQELEDAFAAGPWAEKFPPVLTTDQVAELLQVPIGTLYDWSSRGLLKGCCRRVGRPLRFYRDRLLRRIFNEGIENGN